VVSGHGPGKLDALDPHAPAVVWTLLSAPSLGRTDGLLANSRLHAAASQEQPRALFRSRDDFVSTGRRPLPKHHRALRIHGHHAAQHLRCHVRILERDQSAFALSMQPVCHDPLWCAESRLRRKPLPPPGIARIHE